MSSQGYKSTDTDQKLFDLDAGNKLCKEDLIVGGTRMTNGWLRGTNTDWNIGDATFTISLWLYNIGNPSNIGIIGAGGALVMRFRMRMGNNDELIFSMSSDGSESGGTFTEISSSAFAIQPDTWQHITVTYNHTTDALNLYLDGSVVASGTHAGGLFTGGTGGGGDNGMIGVDEHNQFRYLQNGAINDVAFYSGSEWDLTQVQTIYNNGLPLKYENYPTTGLLNFLELDELGATETRIDRHGSNDFTVFGGSIIPSPDVAHFETVEGTIPVDLVKRSVDGSLIGDTTFTDVFTFDGIGDRIEMVTGFGTLQPVLPLTFECWFKMDTFVPNAGIFVADYYWNGVGENPYWGINVLFASSNNVLAISIGDGDGDGSEDRRTRLSNPNVINTGEWTHLVAVYKGSTDLDIFINGVNENAGLSGTGGAIAWSNNAESITKIGEVWSSGGVFFNGQIKNTKIFAKAFDANDALDAFNSSKYRFI